MTTTDARFGTDGVSKVRGVLKHLSKRPARPSFMRLLACCLVAACARFALAQPVPCNVGTPDGFTGQFCPQYDPVAALPAFPDLTVTGAYACIRNCAPDQQAVSVSVTSFMHLNCDNWRVNVTVTSVGGGTTFFTGTLLLHYARTLIYHRLVPNHDRAQVWVLA